MLKITFDGDKLAVSLLLTEEANQEALNFLKDPQSVFTLDGTNYRVILNKESISGLYGLTLDDPKAKPIPDDLALELVEAQDFNKLTDVVLDKFENGKIKPAKYRIESPCNFEFKGKKYKTTLGRAFFNYAVLLNVDSEFVNVALNKKEQSKILDKQDAICINSMRDGNYDYLENVFIPFLNKWEEVVFICSDLFSPSIDMEIYNTSAEFDRFRAKLIEDNREELEKGNLEVYSDVEKQVTAKLKETTKADTRIFDSGSKLGFGDDLRNGLVCVGPMPIGVGAGKYTISTSSLLEGTTKEERHLHAQSNIVAGYFRAMGPAVGGEISKEIMAAFHDVKLDKKGSDCGRTIGQWYTINDYLAKQLDLRYMIKPSGGLEQLTQESLRTKYMGKAIQVRSVQFCKSKDFCSICSGETPYIIAKDNEVNIGAQKSKTGDEISQASLSKFHSSKTQFVAVNFNDYIVPANADNFDLKQKNIKEALDILFELNSIDHMLKYVESDELLDEIADDIDEVLDETILKNHEEFDEFVENEITLDVHKLSITKAELVERIEDIKKICGRIVKIVMNTFDGTLLNNSEYINILQTLNHFVRENDIDSIIRFAMLGKEECLPYLAPVNDDPEFRYYRMYINILKIPKIDVDKAGLPMKMMHGIHDTFKGLADSIRMNINDDLENPKYDVNYSHDEENHYIYMEPNFILLHDSLPEDSEELIEEGIILDSATKAKLDKKIKSSNNNVRKRYESAINKAIQDAGIQRKRARDNIGETVKEKAAKYEADMRHAKDEYRKTLAKMMQDFELGFMRKNKFRMLKLRNKLNFIFNKKSAIIDSQLNENIKDLKRKMYTKMKESENKLKDKFRV